MEITAFDLAQRYVGIHELAGAQLNHPLIAWWLSLCGYPTTVTDETPWCSAFVNGIHWELRLPRSKSAAARSWLKVGIPVMPVDARIGDVVVLRRGTNPALGHVGFLAGRRVGSDIVSVLGGNQGDGVSIRDFPLSDVISMQRF